MDVSNDQQAGSLGPDRSRRLMGLIALFAVLALLVTACGDDEESSSASSAPAAEESASTTSDSAPAKAEPYAVKGDDPKRPDLRLAGWVPNKKASKEYSIGYFMSSPLNTYVQAMDYGAKTAAAALGVKLEKIQNDWDPQQQLNQLQTALQQKKYDGIVVGAADPDAECRMLSKTIPDAGIPVVITNFPICSDENHTEGTVGVSTSQSLAFYQQWADWAFKTVSEDGGGKVGILMGPPQLGHTKRTKQAIEETAKKYTNVEVVQQLTGDYTSEAGLQQAQTILGAHPDVKGLFSNYDQNTLGAIKALQAADKKAGEVTVFNLGGDHSTFPLMKQDWIQGTQYLEPIEETGQAVEMLVAHLDGASPPKFNNLGEDSTLETVQITKENIGDFVPEF
jgi:ribose transport system substrate-binding protein